MIQHEWIRTSLLQTLSVVCCNAWATHMASARMHLPPLCGQSSSNRTMPVHLALQSLHNAAAPAAAATASRGTSTPHSAPLARVHSTSRAPPRGGLQGHEPCGSLRRYRESVVYCSNSTPQWIRQPEAAWGCLVMSAARRLSTRVVSDQELLMAEPLVNMPCQY
jgi:hypothetical protein